MKGFTVDQLNSLITNIGIIVAAIVTILKTLSNQHSTNKIALDNAQNSVSNDVVTKMLDKASNVAKVIDAAAPSPLVDVTEKAILSIDDAAKGANNDAGSEQQQSGQTD